MIVLEKKRENGQLDARVELKAPTDTERGYERLTRNLPGVEGQTQTRTLRRKSEYDKYLAQAISEGFSPVEASE